MISRSERVLCLFFATRIAVEDVGRENREEHHAQRRQQYCNDFADSCYGENLRTDRRNVHPRPPERIAESDQFRVHARLVIEKHQRREVGEDDDREDVGPEDAAHAVLFADHPFDDDRHGEEGPQHRNQADEQTPIVGQHDAAPVEEVEPRNGDQQVGQMDPEKAVAAFGKAPSDEKVAQENEADDELRNQVGLRKIEVVARNDLPRKGEQQDASCDDLQDFQRSVAFAGDAAAGAIGAQAFSVSVVRAAGLRLLDGAFTARPTEIQLVVGRFMFVAGRFFRMFGAAFIGTDALFATFGAGGVGWDAVRHGSNCFTARS